MIRLIGAGTRPDRETTELDTFRTVPNLVTALRFLGVPLFVWLTVREAYGPAFLTLVAVGSTDWVDGYLARRLGQVSKAGKWLDAVADRLALIIVAATFVVEGIAPAWLVLCIVIPDAVLILTSLLLFRGSPDLPVSTIGKIRTALLLLGAPLLLLQRVPGFDFGWLSAVGTIVLALGCAGHVLAAAGYLQASRAKFARERSAVG